MTTARPVAARLDCPATGLRAYRSARAAKAAHRTVHHRLRAFRCKSCGNYHVTHETKGESA
jgi:hypothetical protein